MTSKYKSIDDLYNIFTSTKLKIFKKSKDNSFANPLDSRILNTNTNNIVNTSYTTKFSRVIKQRQLFGNPVVQQNEKFYFSDIIDDVDTKKKDKDTDFLPDIDASIIGKNIEYFISINLPCPVCSKKTLKLYSSDSMPVIDLICINQDSNDLHNRKTRYFQVKTQVSDENDYFTKDIINVGSINSGFNSHSIKVKDINFNKNTLIGYICIKLYKYHADDLTKNQNIYKIDFNNSFIIIPKDYDVLKNISDLQDEFYYTYTSTTTKDYYIKPNYNLLDILSLRTYKLPLFNSLDTYIDIGVFDNPFHNPVPILKKNNKYIGNIRKLIDHSHTKQVKKQKSSNDKDSEEQDKENKFMKGGYYYNKYMEYKNKYIFIKSFLNKL